VCGARSPGAPASRPGAALVRELAEGEVATERLGRALLLENSVGGRGNARPEYEVNGGAQSGVRGVRQ